MNMPMFLRIGHGIKDGTENINMNSSKKRGNLVDNQKSWLSLTKTIQPNLVQYALDTRTIRVARICAFSETRRNQDMIALFSTSHSLLNFGPFCEILIIFLFFIFVVFNIRNFSRILFVGKKFKKS